MGTIPCLYDTNTRFLLNNGNHPVYGAKNTRYICLIIVTIPFVTLQIRFRKWAWPPGRGQRRPARKWFTGFEKSCLNQLTNVKISGSKIAKFSGKIAKNSKKIALTMGWARRARHPRNYRFLEKIGRILRRAGTVRATEKWSARGDAPRKKAREKTRHGKMERAGDGGLQKNGTWPECK